MTEFGLQHGSKQSLISSGFVIAEACPGEPPWRRTLSDQLLHLLLLCERHHDVHTHRSLQGDSGVEDSGLSLAMMPRLR
ncbi:hypothetical protein Q3G72_030211 [Acer saccharum]|nr:hypothetical protein Q3G72_030211 [Acer saccharum]